MLGKQTWLKTRCALELKTRCASELKQKDSKERIDMKYMKFRLHTR